jgi:colanic acid/amylovoran biosynthesis protein
MTLQIALLNAHNTLNYGTMMMCENVITHMRGDAVDVRFMVPADDPDEVRERLTAATGREDILVHKRHAQFLSSPRIPGIIRKVVDRVLLRYVNLHRSLGKSDVIIVLGGDDLSEYYGRLRIIDIFLRLLSMKLAGRRVFLIGQTIGPFTGYRKALARRVLDRMDVVYHRGPKSQAYARDELKCRATQGVAGDLAFMPLAREQERDILRAHGLVENRYFVLVPSGLADKYHDETDAYLEGLAHIAQHLLNLDPSGASKVVLLPHVLRASDDRPLVKKLGERINAPRVLALTDVLLPFQARALLGGSRMNVSQRMHGAISSLQQGVPVVAVSYSVKYADVLGAYLGLDNLVVEADPSGFTETARQTCACIDRVWNDLDHWRERVEASMKDAEADVARQLNDLYGKLTEMSSR